MFCTVITSSKSSALSAGLTYEWNGDVSAISLGSLVHVPLRSKIVEGIVCDVQQKLPDGIGDVKQIKSVLQKDFLSAEAIEVAKWIATENFCSLRQALNLFLPPLPWSSFLPKPQYVLQIANDSGQKKVKGKNRILIIEALQTKGPTNEDDLLASANVPKSAVEALVSTGALQRTTQEAEKVSKDFLREPAKEITLTTDQREALSLAKSRKPTLLFGVTGSGKTEVYITLALEMLKKGKSVIVLAPEIFLAGHVHHRFAEHIREDSLIMLHSKLTKPEERTAWNKLSSGKPCVVLGTRSALFAPVKNLGAIILDEEHEWTYKNEQTPRYHARTVAEKLAEVTGAILILGTATPSLESWSNVKAGIYELARLKSRYLDAAFPKVEIIDLGEASFGAMYPITTPLLLALQDRLSKKEQSILLLNHRGSATAMLCMDCRRRLVSPVTQLPFTVHHSSNGAAFLFDHASNLRLPVPAACPHCKSPKLREIGAGTQKLEDLLKKALPNARIRRADADVLDKPEDMRKLLEDMREERVDILLGTQLVAKGLDLPKVTLAAVLVADIGLSLPHFRAGERVFQLLSQLTGRSGRHAPGEVLIQTFRPDASEVTYSANHNTEGYLDSELKLRAAYGYPPTLPMVRLLLHGPDAHTTARELLATLEKFTEEKKMSCKLTAGPSFFSGGKTWQLLLRGKDAVLVGAEARGVGVSIDVNPMETL